MKRFVGLVALTFLTAANSAHAAGRTDTYADQLGRLINDYRARQGLRPLALVASLSDLAREHAARMAREDRLSHDGFQQRFARAHSPRCVENVGSNAGGPAAAFEAWRNSPTHAHNLVDARITRMGIAIDGRYVAFFACS